jgi:signal transduction histidine kinase
MLIIGVTLLVLAAAIGLTTRQVRSGIRAQIIGRDADVLYAVLTTQLDEQRSLELDDPEPSNQLTAVLVASRLKGVLGARLFDPRGVFIESFPPLVREAELSASDLSVLRESRPVSRFLSGVDPREHFYSSNGNGTKTEAIPLFVVEVPLHTTRDEALQGIAQFLIEGHSMRVELERLDRQLTYQALVAFGAASVILMGSLGWAFRRLRQTHALLSDKTDHLERANEELARMARTTAVGAITAHLIHGLRSPLTGLQHFVASLGNGEGEARSAEWETAVLTTRRMQSLISEVVNVLREEELGSAYELSVDDLLGLIRNRVEPLASESGVRLEWGVGGLDLRLMNRTANLLKLILLNLVENAIYATPSGKLVRVEVEGGRESIRFLIRDEGPGFPQMAQGNVFAPRRSGREGGAGIGLAISKQLADYLGAALELQSTSPRGCVFALSLPMGSGHEGYVTARGTRADRAGTMLLAFLAPALCWAGAEDGLRWRWSNPSPHGNNIVDMAYSQEQGLAVQVTERGGVYSSRDMTLWIPRESGTRKALRAAAFLGQRLVITGEEGTVLYADSEDEIRAGTLSDGSTLDWLEGCAASPEQSVAVGDNGTVYASTDGVSWQRQQSGTLVWLRGAAYGAGKFVAVGESGTILTSTNGTQWTKVSSGTTVDLNRVAFIGTAFVAVGDDGVVRVSANGSSWQGQSPNTPNALLGVGASGVTRLVVGDDEVRLYENNRWYNQMGGELGPPPWLYYSVWGGTDRYLVGGHTGLMVEGQRLGMGNWAWQMRSPSVRRWLFDLTWVAGLYVAVGDRGVVMTSTEGVDWDLEVVPESLANVIFLGVGGTTNLLVAAGSQGGLMISPNTLTNVVWTNDFGTVITQAVSTLGIIWQAIEPRPATNDLQGVTFHDGRYYVSGDRGLVLSSGDGTNWVRHQTPTTRLLSGIVGFPAGVVATGDDGAMVFSAEGTDWVELPAFTTNWLYRVRYLNETLFAVGQGGVIYRSTNAVDWQMQSSGVTQWLNDVSWVGGRYYIAGTGGAVLASEDGLTWTGLGTITPKSLYGLATDGRQLVAAGFEGVILRSPIVPDLTPVEILGYSRIPIEETGAYQNLFLFGGRVDQRFRVEYRDSVEPGLWTAGPEFEFLDSSGVLFYLETVPAAEASATEYYRATLAF